MPQEFTADIGKLKASAKVLGAIGAVLAQELRAATSPWSRSPFYDISEIPERSRLRPSPTPGFATPFEWPRPCILAGGTWTTIVMLKIERISESGVTRLCLSGELRSAHLEEVRAEIERISPRLVLDLAEIGVVDIYGVRWLNACQTMGVRIENCAPYIREWMLQEK